MPGESGQPRRLHSNSIWPQPQAHISLPPTRSYCEWTAPSIVTAIAIKRVPWIALAQKRAPRFAHGIRAAVWESLRIARLCQNSAGFHCWRGWYLCARIVFTFRPRRSPLQIRNQRNCGSEDYNHHADPDPGDQRMQLGANLRLAGVGIAAVEDDVQVALGCFVQRYHGCRLFMVRAGEVDAPLRRQLLDELVAAIDVQQRVIGIVFRRRVLGDALAEI